MDDLFTLDTLPVHPTLAVGAEGVEHVLVRVTVARTPTGPRPRLAAVLVLDTSGSMKGEPLAQVVQSAQRLADILGDDDSLGVVAFDIAARTVSPLRMLSGDARSEVRRETAALEAGGNTNMSGGLAHAALLFPARSGGERHLAVVLSDGQPNVGASSPSALAAEVRRIRERGVAVSTLGFGAHHSDDVMVAVADAGGGRYAFIGDPKLAGSSFAQAVGAQRDVMAEETRLVLAPAEGVEIARVLGDPPTSVGVGGLRVTLPDLIAGDELNLVVELRVQAPREEGAWSPLGVTLTGRRVVTGEAFALHSEAAVTVSAEGRGEADAVAQWAVAIALADESRTRARALADRGDYRGAAEILRQAKAALEATPGFVAGADGPLGDAHEALIDEIAAMDRVPAPEEYQKFKKASRDYMDFAQGGTKMRGGGGMATQLPSAQVMMNKMAGAIVPKAALVMVDGPAVGTAFPLSGETDIGRGEGTAIRIKDPTVSRRHARVVFQGGGFWAFDLGSTAGMQVNGQRVERAPLQPGDVLQVGTIKLRFEWT